MRKLCAVFVAISLSTSAVLPAASASASIDPSMKLKFDKTLAVFDDWFNEQNCETLLKMWTEQGLKKNATKSDFYEFAQNNYDKILNEEGYGELTRDEAEYIYNRYTELQLKRAQECGYVKPSVEDKVKDIASGASSKSLSSSDEKDSKKDSDSTNTTAIAVIVALIAAVAAGAWAATQGLIPGVTTPRP